jgi:hypothetical protein
MINPDQVVKSLLNTVEQQAEANFRRFVIGRGITKWIIASDLVVGDSSRPNDAFAFTVFPYDAPFDQMQREIRTAGGSKDLKKIKSVGHPMLNYLREARRFTFGFIVNKDREWVPNVETARKKIDFTIALMRKWRDADQQRDIIGRFVALRQKARANAFNTKLFGDIVLTSTLAGFVAMLLVKHGSPEIIGWFPDRDKITSAYDKIAHDLFSVDASAFCQQIGIDRAAVKLAIGVPGNPEGSANGNWYDDLLRVPDYVAGTLAAWNIEKNLVPAAHPKFREILRGAVADNSNLLVLRLRLAADTAQASRVQVSLTSSGSTIR